MFKIAVYSAKGLGDGLLYMILSHNLSHKNHIVTFNTSLSQLKRWFPGHTILPFPEEKEIVNTLSSFDLIIASDHSPAAYCQELKDKLIVIKKRDFNKKKTMVQNLVSICQKKFYLPSATAYNGMTLPSDIQHGRFQKRVVLHPMSLELKRMWPKHKFLQLADLLAKDGFEPAICVAQFERKEWTDLMENREGIAFPNFSHLDDFATYIAESKFMIGNDSGIGHLASNLGIETLSLFARKGYSHLWRPGWNQGHVVCPPPLLFGARLKEKYWKKLLNPKKVKKYFKKSL